MSERSLLAVIWPCGVAIIALVGLFDYASGAELRIYPLYFGPVAFLGWYAGRRGAAIAAVLSGATWLVSNLLAGMRFSSEALWVANAAVHSIAFLFVGLIIAQLRRGQILAQELSRTDPLTLLRNRRAFYEDIAPLLSLCRRSGRPVTVAFIDLDNFKDINDRHGHEAGDNLLCSVAQALRNSVRPSDLTTRLGGDEFAVFFPALDEVEVAAALERVKAAIMAAGGALTGVTASIGAITFRSAPAGIEALVRRADSLMYASKTGGRNRISHQVVAAGDDKVFTPASPDQRARQG